MKNNRWLILLAKIILLTVVCYFFYCQFKRLNLENLSQVSPSAIWPIFICFLLIFVNWYFEFLKWNKSLNYIYPNTSRSIKVKSFMAGVLTGFMTPNLLGNFIGRIFYFDSSKRPALIGITLFSNAAQFLASILFGMISIFIIGLPKNINLGNSQLMIVLALIICFTLVLIFLFLKKIPDFFFRWKWGQQLKESLQTPFLLRLRLLDLSLRRHIVFSLQYLFLLIAFGFSFEFENLFLIWQVYFWSTLIPSIWFGKLIIRESVALWIFGFYTDQLEAVLFASVLLWLMNQGITALIGIPYLKLNKQKA